MSRPTIKCPKCEEIHEHHAKGMCYNCYKRFGWKRKLVTYPRCKRQKPHHSQGYCNSCYNYLFNLEQVKAWNYKSRYNLDIQTYRNLTKACVICGFDKIVDLHHLDHNKNNNSRENFIALCPNHHKMIHIFKWREEVLSQIRKALQEKEPALTIATQETHNPTFNIIKLPELNNIIIK